MDNNITSDPYALVLSDLRAKREQIDQAIAALEMIQGGLAMAVVGTTSTTPSAQPAGLSAGSPDVPNGALLGMSIADAAKKILIAQRRQMQTPEIVAALEKGGVVLTSNDKNNTVGSLLLRRFYNTGDIVRVNRGVWGLQEWYPGRKFAKGNRVGEERESASAAKDAGEQEVSNFDKPTTGAFDTDFEEELGLGSKQPNGPVSPDDDMEF
jgi:DNA-directed RNA polymerase delta subunit